MIRPPARISRGLAHHLRSRRDLRRTLLLAVGVASLAGGTAVLGSVHMTPVHGQIPHASGPLPTYEVATIKPWDGTGYGQPLRSYIQSAFNISSNSTNRLIGPDWINRKSYVIRGKVPDAMRDAMQKMASKDLVRENQLLAQSLLADRFKLKVHFETREMPVFELVAAKGGARLKEVPAARGGVMISNRGQMTELKGTSASIDGIIRMLMTDSEIDGRPVIDKTGLVGTYDLTLDWLPSHLPTKATPGTIVQPGSYGPAPPADAEGPSLFAALEEQLGLKLVATKGPVEVVVIDSIEVPSEN